MRIRDHQLHAAQAAACELVQECRPEGLGFGRADVHAEHLAATIAVHSNGNDDGDRYDAPALAHLHVGRVDPQIRPVPLDRATQKAFDLFVDLGRRAG